MKLLVVLYICCIGYSSLGQNKELRKNCANGIMDKVRATLITSEDSYDPCNFGALTIHKPTEYYDLEELYEVQKTLPTFKHYPKDKLDSLIKVNKADIQNKKQEIMDKKLYFSYEMTHTFIKKSKQGSFNVYRYNFYLNHAYIVKNVELKFAEELGSGQAKEFEYFQKRIPIYTNLGYQGNIDASNEIYDFFELALEDTDFETDVLHASLRAINNIRNKGELDLDSYGKQAISTWIDQNRSSIEKYKSKDFGYMLELSDTLGKTAGYRMFHRYTYSNKKENEEDVVQFDFDKYFVIRSITRISPPYDEYFKKD